MKRIFAICLALCMLLSLSACGKGDAEQKNSGITQSGEVKTTADQGKSEEDTQSGIELVYTFEDPANPVVFDYPDMGFIIEATSRIFKRSNFFIAYCKGEKTVALKDVPSSLTENFKYAVSSHLDADFDSFTIESSEEIEINGTKVLKIEGFVNSHYSSSGREIKFPMHGYTFAKNGSVFELLGIMGRDASTEDQAEMEATVDAMIKTLRDDR